MGSNAFKLLIWDLNKDKLVFETKEFVKIGRESYFSQVISPDAMARSVDCLINFKKVAKQHKAKSLYAIATSAIRTSINQNAFLDFVKNNTDIIINIIDGDTESELIYAGVKKSMENPMNMLVMDIGGGSSEFIVAKDEQLQWYRSYPLGVSRLLEMYHPSDPLTENEKLSVFTYLKRMHNRTEAAILHYKPEVLVGSQGFFETFYHILEARKSKARKNIPTFEIFNKRDLILLCHEIIQASYKERCKMKGMEVKRADTIQFAALSLLYILSSYAFEQIAFSKYSLKEGVVTALKEKDNTWQKSLL